jgi:uncharacterized membrane protein
MEIAGLPLHPLVVHASVVLVPLAVVTVIAFAVGRRHRWATRWPACGLTVAALLATWVAKLSGESLAETRPELEQLVRDHAERADQLAVVVTLFAVATAAGVWTLGGPSTLLSGRGAVSSRSPVLEKTLPVVLVLLGVAVLVWVVLVGDSGARAVWG